MTVESVRRFFAERGESVAIIELAVSTATVALAAQAHGVEPGRIAKTLAFRLANGSVVLLVARGDARIDNRKFKAAFGKDPVLIREGGSIPIVQTFQDILGVDTLLLGLALADAQIHAPNENFPVENFEAGIRMSEALLRQLGKTS